MDHLNTSLKSAIDKADDAEAEAAAAQQQVGGDVGLICGDSERQLRAGSAFWDASRPCVVHVSCCILLCALSWCWCAAVVVPPALLPLLMHLCCAALWPVCLVPHVMCLVSRAP